MENESKFNKSLEETLREKGYRVEKVKEGELAGECDRDDCFKDAAWFIEGYFYCPVHKERAVKILEESYKEVERKKLGQKRAEEGQKKSSSKWILE